MYKVSYNHISSWHIDGKHSFVTFIGQIMLESAEMTPLQLETFLVCKQSVVFPNGFVFNLKPVALTLITHFFTHPECNYENYCKVETSSKCSLSNCDTTIV